MVLATVVVLQVIGFATAKDRRTIFGPLLGADFAGFYIAGWILYDYPPAALYDAGLQWTLYHELFPTAPAGVFLPFAHGPFFALLMLPFAMLPYPLAYVLFLLITPALYAAGLLVVRPVLKHLTSDDAWTGALLALSYLPFLAENWVGGQFAAFGFLWMAIAVRCALSGQPFAAGLPLSMCFYKPTLLVVILPMLLIGRQFRILLGVIVGGVALACLSVLVVGIDGCAAYARLLLNYTHGADASAGFRAFKYVDLVTFFRPAFGGFVLTIGVASILFAVLARTWWSYGRLDDDARRLAWAAALTLTPVLNVYAPIYDTLLPVLGLLLTADVLTRRETPMPDSFRILLALMFVVPSFSQALASSIGFQPFTLVLIGAGIYPLWSLFRYSGRGGQSNADASHVARPSVPRASGEVFRPFV